MKRVHNAYMVSNTSNLAYENEVLNLCKPCTNAYSMYNVICRLLGQ